MADRGDAEGKRTPRRTPAIGAGLAALVHLLTMAIASCVLAETGADAGDNAAHWRQAGAVLRSYSVESALAFAADCPGASIAGSSGDAAYWHWEEALFSEALAQRLQLHSHLADAARGTGGTERGRNCSLPAVTESAGWDRPHYCVDAKQSVDERVNTEEEDRLLMRTCYDSSTKRRMPCSIAQSDSALQDAIIKRVWCYWDPVCAARDYFDKDAEQRLVAKIITDAEYEI